MENSPRVNATGVYFPCVWESLPSPANTEILLESLQKPCNPQSPRLSSRFPSSLQTHLPFPNSPTRPYPAECCSCCWVWSGLLLPPRWLWLFSVAQWSFAWLCYFPQSVACICLASGLDCINFSRVFKTPPCLQALTPSTAQGT